MIRPVPGAGTLFCLAVSVGVCCAFAAAPAVAQNIGALVSPGPLSQAHAKLEGLENCQKCHEPGRKVTAERCLACHKPIAAEMAAKKGVHRAVTNDCVSCHMEHAGRDADIRPIDHKKFNHLQETGFPLDGKHAVLAGDCAKCHKTRSFLGVSAACATCHQDPHKGTLGANCVQCHATSVAFKETEKGFDHSKTAFPLSLAHLEVACAKCHVNQVYKGLKFALCTDCHTDVHKTAFGTACADCHTGKTWQTDKVDHSRTQFALAGKHRSVACVDCHHQPPMRTKLAFDRCAVCHRDPHKGEFKQDCVACHTPESFKNAPFDHGKQTGFPLTGEHAKLPCSSCHKNATTTQGVGTTSEFAPSHRGSRATPSVELASFVVTVARASQAVVPEGERPAGSRDFRGLSRACASCHQDPHKGALGAKCESCHTSETFKVTTFTHPGSPEFFGGQHATVACGKCHGGEGVTKSGFTGKAVAQRAFRGLSTDCASCHRDVHLGQLGSKCQSCHSIGAAKFAAVNFSHTMATFQLAGKHLTVECAKCHRRETGTFPASAGETVRYVGVASACASCHKDPHLGQLGANCQSCHTPTAFKLATYTHKGDPDFHVDSHLTVKCADCHKSVEADFPAGRGVAIQYAGLTSACANCHKDPHEGTLGTHCESCHTPHKWGGASRAFHKATLFPLEGQHLGVPCASCHINGQIKGTPNRCYDCHWVRHQDDRFRTRLGTNCENCHRPTSWRAVIWNHGEATGFQLSAVHATLDCESCHHDQEFHANTPADCYSCHRQDFQATKAPPHVAAGFPTACETCHKASDATWQQATFDHSATGFPLLGVHATQVCAACHSDGVYKGKSTACVSCHITDFNNSKNPSHAAAGFTTACDSCHKVSDPSWSVATFNHSATGFALVGMHATQACSACHGDNVFKGKSTACVSCHLTDFNNSKNPSHTAAGFPTTCDTCHKVSDMSWQAATAFNHSTTAFPLQGVHATQACSACHGDNVFKGKSTACVSCHQTDYNNSQNPNHAAAGFPTTCDTCHKVSDPSWSVATFNHNATAFPLQGVHATQACKACHGDNVFKGKSTACVSCHQTDYTKTTNPNHAAAGFPTTCDTCHKVSDPSWTVAVFNHAATGFALVGVHATQPCSACHANGQFTTMPTTCVSCHQTDYNKTTNPNHAAAGFPTACDTCHKATDSSWNQAVFNHSATGFTLVGVHATQPCSACHANGQFGPLPTTCVSCHLSQYNGATNPNHVAAGFPTTCDTCHKATDTAWTQGTFNHAATGFALVGVHATQPCSACHANGQFGPLPTTCVSCHLTAYNQTTNPNHAAAGFPTTCDTCHRATDTSWTQATFNHSVFPLSGIHATTPCASCHINGNYTTVPTTCIGCHQTDFQNATTPVNHAGFSTTCTTCHSFSDAAWTLASTFNHASYFPLAGAHTTAACQSCHINGNYTTVPRSPCYACHATDYQNATSPVNHIAAGFPTTCDSCHHFSDTSWTQGTFNHSIFPLAGVHATIPCSSCHINGNYTTIPTTCIGCHQTDFQNATAPVNHAGFSTTCTTCHSFSDAAWTLASTFNHASYFPLAGAHTTAPCASCHINGNYTTVPTSPCYACHATDYQNAISPVNHIAAGFPTTCDTCHHFSDTSWTQAVFNHTWFPQNHGNSGGVCATCHTNPSNYAVFSCTTGCHPRSQTDPHHTGVPGYVYDSNACYSCHPRGQGG